MFCFVSTLSTRHKRDRQYYHYVYAKSFRFMMRKTSIAQKLSQDKTKSIFYRLYCPFVQDVPALFSKKKVINQKLINRKKKKNNVCKRQFTTNHKVDLYLYSDFLLL